MGLSLDDLAAKSHISAVALGRFERGETKLLKLGRITIEKLFADSGLLFDMTDRGDLVLAYPERLEAEHIERKTRRRLSAGSNADAAL